VWLPAFGDEPGPENSCVPIFGALPVSYKLLHNATVKLLQIIEQKFIFLKFKKQI